MAQSKNRILNSLPQNIFAAVEPHLKHEELIFGAVVAETDSPVDSVYLPHTGVISLVVEMLVGDMIETAVVGRDGVVNGTSALDGKIALHRGIVQVAGEASTVSPDALRMLADEFEPLRAMLVRHEQVLLAQARQSLQKAGFIKYSRGHIRLLDIAQLEDGACECYQTVKGHYERLLAA